MRQLTEICAALLVGAGHLAIALPVRIALGRLLDVFGRAEIAPSPAGRHRLTGANRRRAYRPVVGHVRWHGQPGEVAPSAVTAGIWTEEAAT